MSYIIWNDKHGAIARVEGDPKSARLKKGDLAIPCESDADVNDQAHWAQEAREIQDHVPTLEEVKAAKLAEIAAARYEQEIGGVEIPMGNSAVTIRTDRESQGMITGAALKAMQDNDYVCHWKTPEGFVSVTAEQIMAVADAVRNHVQTCFDREAGLVGLVGEATTVSAVEEITWETSLK